MRSMARKGSSGPGFALRGKKRDEFMRELADKFIEQIESGDVGMWKRPWTSGGILMVPHNIRSTTNNPSLYRGINNIILMLSGWDYPTQQWGTFDQWKEVSRKHAKSKGEFEVKLGKNGKKYESTTEWYGVKKGESGTKIVFWKPLIRTEYNPETKQDEDKVQSIMMRVYTVFNREQTGLPPLEEALNIDLEGEEFNQREKNLHDLCKWYAENPPSIGAGKMDPIKINHGGDRAFYTPSNDNVHIPHKGMFDSNLHYLSTLCHELLHSTGHSMRLNRNMSGNRFGDKAYAFEELVVEFATSMLLGACGLSGDLRHIEYIASWVRGLKDDPEALMRAAQQAQKAVDYMLDNYAKHLEEQGEMLRLLPRVCPVCMGDYILPEPVCGYCEEQKELANEDEEE
jgi:putative DNA primase/helicase